MTMRLFYCGRTWDDTSAERIMVANTLNAFAASGVRVTATIRSSTGAAHAIARQDGARMHKLRSPHHAIFTVLYGIRAFMLLLRERSLRGIDLVYSRSHEFALLAALFGRCRVGIELHGMYGISRPIERAMLRLAVRRGLRLVTTTHALATHLRNELGISAPILIAPNGHGFVCDEPPDLAPASALRVGYFGTIQGKKGAALLRELVQHNDGVEFHVYSQNQGQLPATPALATYSYLPHHQVFARMGEMDCLLLLVEPEPGPINNSRFTSPMKMWEYLARGRPIVATNLPVLREILSDGHSALLCENTREAFSAAFARLRHDPALGRGLARTGLRIARGNTWTTRARRVLRWLRAGRGIPSIPTRDATRQATKAVP